MRNAAARASAAFGAALLLAVSATEAATPGPALRPARAVAPIDPGEAVAIDSAAAAALPRLEPEESVSAYWPVAPGRRASIVLTRHEIYSADARIVSIESGREVPVPRSRLRFFWGGVEDELETRVLVVWDPDGGRIEATSWSAGAVYRLSRETASGASGSGYRLARAQAETSDGASPAWTCAGEEGSLIAPESAVRAPSAARAPLLSGSFTAVIAIDTDNAFMASRGNSTVTALNYMANLIANMNTQTYQPDFTSVTLVQGYTILRPSTTPDPYITGAGGNADPAKLSDFSGYWNSHYSFVKRALALMISGKQPGSGSASGIAWIGGGHSALLCNSSNGYSFNQVFTGGDFYQTIAQLVAHEIGHNMGAPHTHCEGLDQCYNLESCYMGPQVCPGGPGTLMSYCHITCSGATAHFHPTQQAYVNTNFQNAATAGVCVFPLITGPAVASNSIPGAGPVSGGTTITVNGSNIAANALVSVNGVLAKVTGTTPTQITAVTGPSASVSLGNVVLTNLGQAASTLTNAWIYHFNDVPPANGFYSFVNKLAFDGITSGCGSGNYCPTSSVTRGQMAVFLLRSNDGIAYNPPACTTPVFSDVPCSNPFAAWINELAARSVTSGCGGGQYCIGDPVTRAQMAVFLLRTKDGPTYTPPACTTAPFADVPCSSGFAIWIQELVARGITTGCGGGNYCPNSSATRGQMAVFLVTTFNLP